MGALLTTTLSTVYALYDKETVDGIVRKDVNTSIS